jgi:hypothetical protein
MSIIAIGKGYAEKLYNKSAHGMAPYCEKYDR